MENINKKEQVLEAYSRGEIDWQKAINDLDLINFDDLEDELMRYGLHVYEGPVDESKVVFLTNFLTHVVSDNG